jgi:FixJ family two-component response regulator
LLETVIHIVDDDDAVRIALARLLRSVGYTTMMYASASEFLNAKLPDTPGCVVLDVRMPGTSGLDLQEHLNRNLIELPLVLMTGYGDIQMSVRAMKAGAVDFLTKPFRDQDMLDAIGTAVELHRSRRTDPIKSVTLKARYDRLSGRERQVMKLACEGRLNKQIAAELGIQEITVKLHRSAAMKKMQSKSLAELVRMAETLRLFHEQD